MSKQPRKPFSKRFGYYRYQAITVREDAPTELRRALVSIAHETGLTPSELREIIRQPTPKRDHPGTSKWISSVMKSMPTFDYASVFERIFPESSWQNVQNLVDKCDWFRVYDIIEGIYERLVKAREGLLKARQFEKSINEYFGEEGIGWQLVHGAIQTRGDEAFETSVRGAIEVLKSTERPTASREIHLALQDLSRRPDPDVTGAIQHAIAGLECVARDVSGKPKHTLGKIINDHPDLFPPPINQAIEKIWGYACEMGRHLQEGRVPDREEAELVVGLAATATTYLAQKALKQKKH